VNADWVEKPGGPDEITAALGSFTATSNQEHRAA